MESTLLSADVACDGFDETTRCDSVYTTQIDRTESGIGLSEQSTLDPYDICERTSEYPEVSMQGLPLACSLNPALHNGLFRPIEKQTKLFSFFQRQNTSVSLPDPLFDNDTSSRKRACLTPEPAFPENVSLPVNTALSLQGLIHLNNIKGRFTKAQQEIITAILLRKSIVVLGMGGTGKTHTVMSALVDKFAAMCLSASVAVNLRILYRQFHGESSSRFVFISHIHRLLSIPAEMKSFLSWKRSLASVTRKHILENLIHLVSNIQILVLDEIFSGGTELFKMVSEIFCFVKKEKWFLDNTVNKKRPSKSPSHLNAPFGGLPIVLIGDPGQLLRRTEDGKNYDYVFESDLYKQIFPDYKNHFLLTEVMRQENPELRELSTEIAYGSLEKALQFIKGLPCVSLDDVTADMGPIIANKKDLVTRLNKQRYERYSGREYGPFVTKVSVRNMQTASELFQRNEIPFMDIAGQTKYFIPNQKSLWEDTQVPSEAQNELFLKMWTMVMFYINISETWTNGTLCYVVGFSENNEPIVMRQEVYNERVKAFSDKMDVPITAVIDHPEFYLYDLENDIKLDTVCIVKPFKYDRKIKISKRGKYPSMAALVDYHVYPIMLAFALTTAKVQGLSFTSTVVVVDDYQYDPNLDVVKMSRARKHMYVLGKVPDSYRIKRDTKTLQFYQHILSHSK